MVSGSTYGDQGLRTKYFFDLKKKKVLLKRDVFGMNFSGAFDMGSGRLLLVAKDAASCGDWASPSRTVFFDIPGVEPAPTPESIHLVEHLEKDSNPNAVLAIEVHGGHLDVGDERSKYHLRVSVPPEKKARALPDLTKAEQVPSCDIPRGGKALKGGYCVHRDEICKRESDGTLGKCYRSPAPSYELFKKHRERKARSASQFTGTGKRVDGYEKELFTLGTAIGPTQLREGKIWFGLTFYDSEGSAGVGGLGFFDLKTRRYEVKHYNEMVDWSANSILVDDEYIYTGLTTFREGFSAASYLFRVKREDEHISVYKIPQIIRGLFKHGNALNILTYNGLYVLAKDELLCINADLKVDGKYVPVIKKVPLEVTTRP